MLDFTHPEGTFVLIEGNMTSENGTIVYFDQHMRYHEKVYEEINDNEIGNVLQDMHMANGKIYFITQNGKTSSMGTTFNGDGRFVVCDAHTMKRLVARDMQFYANVDTSTGATQSSKSTLCWPQHIVVVSPEKPTSNIPRPTTNPIRASVSWTFRPISSVRATSRVHSASSRKRGRPRPA